MGGVCSGGYLLGGVYSGGCLFQGGCLLPGGSTLGGVCLGACLLLGGVCSGVSTEADTSPCEQNDRQVQKYYLGHNFVTAGNENVSVIFPIDFLLMVMKTAIFVWHPGPYTNLNTICVIISHEPFYLFSMHKVVSFRSWSWCCGSSSLPWWPQRLLLAEVINPCSLVFGLYTSTELLFWAWLWDSPFTL